MNWSMKSECWIRGWNLSDNYQDDQVKRIAQQDSTFIEDILIEEISKIYEDTCEEKAID